MAGGARHKTGRRPNLSAAREPSANADTSADKRGREDEGGGRNAGQRKEETRLRNTIQCGPHEYIIGLCGWRRKCLYSLVLLLLVTVIINLALTLFIFRVLDFRTDGMGGLEIVDGGIVASGEVHVMETLVATQITSRPHSPIRIFASNNFTVAAVDSAGQVTSSFFLDDKALEIITNELQIKDTTGRLMFSATQDKVTVGASRLIVEGEGGSVFSGSVQTPLVSAPSGEALLLESLTRNLEVSAPRGVFLESRAGKIRAECLEDFILQSTGGVIKFNSPKIYVKGLATSSVMTPEPSKVKPNVYQVCVCSGGKIFLATPDGVCAADHNFCK